jgi:hypothetical protein
VPPMPPLPFPTGASSKSSKCEPCTTQGSRIERGSGSGNNDAENHKR